MIRLKIGSTVRTKRHATRPGRVGVVVSDWPGRTYHFGVRLEGDEAKAAPTPFKRNELHKLGWLGRWLHNRRTA
jgi:hypothetical protein